MFKPCLMTCNEDTLRNIYDEYILSMKRATGLDYPDKYIKEVLPPKYYK